VIDFHLFKKEVNTDIKLLICAFWVGLLEYLFEEHKISLKLIPLTAQPIFCLKTQI